MFFIAIGVALVLSAYASYLATAGSINQEDHVSETGQAGTAVSGKVARIGWTVLDGQALYSITLEGDASHHIFTASPKVFSTLPLVEAGDEVSLTYLNTGEEVESVMTFTDQSGVLPVQKDATGKKSALKK